MREIKKCSSCGAALAGDVPGGHCLPCLLQLGLAATEELPQLKPGDRVGHYLLVEQLGEGGCGIVFLARQEDPVRREVALKILKLGMDTRQFVARFEAERQLLASLDHPNIATIFDAGATETGRPFFVMELVRGVKITDYCDQQKLSTRERLELFVQVCRAVQYAHQKGIIHRDLKPSNILVTGEGSGRPSAPKIIDFGIAKSTEPGSDTLVTAWQQFLGTPAYMSPEQAGADGIDIDTRSDIYSLGVLLYELLTGLTPFDAAELRRSPFDEVLNFIREIEPPRPSIRVAKLAPLELKTVANHRQIETAKLPSLLQGDLDWIVMKCMEKDRIRRYESASGLGADLQRHLDNKPVIARPPTNAYRFHKFIRRHQLACAAASAVLAALVLGLAVSTWLFLREREADQRAEITLKIALNEAGKSREVALLEQLGQAQLQLGELDAAEANVREALTQRTKLFGGDSPEAIAALNNLGLVLRSQNRLGEAEKVFRDSREKSGKLTGNEPLKLICLSNLGAALWSEGQFAEAEIFYREALVRRQKLLGKEHPDVAISLNNLATVLRSEGKFAEAEIMEREALAVTVRKTEK